MGTNHFRGGVAALAIATALVSGACSGSTASIAGALASAAAADASDNAAGQTDLPAAGSSAAVPDPCAALTIADVQPFFTVPIATQLRSAVPNTCEWAGNDGGGGLATSLDVMVMGGDDAALRWQLSTTGPAVTFSGVGDHAEHLPGIADFLAIKDGVVCGITTVGYTHLVGKVGHEPGLMPDADATAIAQNYGTLCNRIYGSGNTTPTVAAAAPPSTAAGSPAPSVAIPAVGGTFGPGFPLPVGIDCSGSHTSTDIDGSPMCEALTSGDPHAIYPFYLQTLPAEGYTIHVERDGLADDGTEIASIMFGGNGIGDFSTVDLRGLTVDITLRQP
jgi:hypothetical protein